MDEVMVTAPKVEPLTQYERVANVLSIREESIEQSGTQDVYNLLKQKVPGLSLIKLESEPGAGALTMAEFQNVFAVRSDEEKDEYITLGVRGDEVSLIVDGSLFRQGMQLAIIKTLVKNDIAQIDVIRSPASLSYDPMSSAGVIAITTKQGGGKYNAKWHPTNLKTIMPLGFQKPAEFYVPRYDLIVDKESKTPDLRTTIHWQPHLKVQDGKANIEFYTADGPVDYSVVIEGVGKDGRLLRVEEKIK
jgi:outer membrane receptor for ferrienterochelin and colicin